MLKRYINFFYVLPKTQSIFANQCKNKSFLITSKNLDFCQKITLNTYTSSECFQKTQKDVLRNLFTNKFGISNDQFNVMITSKSSLLYRDINDIEKILSVCSKNNIDQDMINNNMWIFEMKSEIFIKRLLLIKSLNLREISHGLPFLKMSTKSLAKLCYRIHNEAPLIPYGNRLYYLSEKMQIDPMVMAVYISKRLFVYHVPFEHLENTLNILLDMGVSPISILKDLWVLRYKPEVVKERLERLQRIGKKKLMPWMVKCSNHVFERSIHITKTTNELLGDNKSVMSYLAERLKCSNESVIQMSQKIPAILTVRVTKVKHILDFLFDEGFTEKDIILVPRVLAHSAKTMKIRLQELRSLGVEPRTLNILCKSKRDFQKHIETLSRPDFKFNKTTYIKEKQILEENNDDKTACESK